MKKRTALILTAMLRLTSDFARSAEYLALPR